MVHIYKLFDVNKTIAKRYLRSLTYPWEVLENIEKIIKELGSELDKKYYFEIYPKVWVHKSAKIAKSAVINGPCIIDENCEIRHSAFIRGKAILGKNTVIGNSVEVKNSIVFDDAQIPHFNYVGDSVIGYKAHLGAGVITSNLKSDKSRVFIYESKHSKFYTGLKKCGAFVGDCAEIGCNSVLNPGSVIGKNSIVYPLSSVRGYVPENSIYKSRNQIIERNM